MSNASYVITVSSPRSVADLARFIKDTSEPREQALALSGWFKRIADGLEPGALSFNVQTSSSAPVRASGTITLTYASISANDTVTVGGTVLTCVTGTPSGAQFKKVTDGATTATNLANLINSNATTSLLFKASAASTVVTVTALAYGKIGNQATLATSNGTGFVVSAANLASGAGGAETVAVNYVRG